MAATLSNGADVPTYTILEADGQHEENELEETAFAPQPGQNYRVKFIRSTLAPPGYDILRPWTNVPKEIRDQVDGLMILKLFLTAEDIELFPKLKVVVRMGVGYDRLDRQALAKKGVIVCNVPDYGTAEIADHAIGLTLSMRRGILLHNDMQRGPKPAQWTHIESPLVARIQGATFGVLGMGRIGTATVLRAKAFGWNVLMYDPFLPNGADKAVGVERTKDIKELFRRSTVLSVHCPSTRSTRGMVNWDLLQLLPPGALLVNTARGDIIDLDGVEKALKNGNLAGAALDVLPIEPIPDENIHPLLKAYRDKEPWLTGRMVLTCHTAFYSPGSIYEIRLKSAQTMRDVLIDGVASNIINPETE